MNLPPQQATKSAIDQAFQQALECHRAGRYTDAERLYRAILRVDPKHPVVNHNLGVLSVLMQQPAAGLPFFMAALDADPSRGQYWTSYIDALFQAGQLEDARDVLALARQQGLEGGDVDSLELRLELRLKGKTPKTEQADKGFGGSFEKPLLVASAIQQVKAIEPKVANRAYTPVLPTGTPSPQDIDTLVALFRAGRYTDAIPLAQEMTSRFPGYESGWKVLGLAYNQMGRSAEALTVMQKVAELSPHDAEAHNNLGIILQDLGRFDEAETSYLQAININPNYAEAFSNLGSMQQDRGRLKEAEANFIRALDIKPDFAEGHYNLGNIYKETNRLDQAISSYRQALKIKPDYAEAHNNLGVALMGRGRLNEAEASYKQALLIKPDYAEAHNNLGITLQDLGRSDEAIFSFLKALEVKPNSAEVYHNLGGAMIKPEDAMACLLRAVEIKPDYAQAYNTLGNIQLVRGQFEDAADYFRKALKFKPDYDMAHSNLIFTLDLMVGEDIRSLQEERKRWDAAHGARWHQQWTHPNVPNPERRLRVGYVSADIWGKSSIKVFGGMLTRYDRSAFDVYVYSNAKGKDDKFTDLFKQNVTVWRDIVGLSDDAATDLIRKDQIDILVDLSGHSSGHRLLVFARKPAPIQVTAWGYASGTGMRAMDVFLTDPVMVPPQDKQYFAEEIRYLPCVVGAFFNEHFPEVNELPALSAGTITFGCFNRLMKVTEETYRVWAEILLATPNSKLILKTPETVAAQARVIENFTKAGVDTERIIMLGGTAWYEHMQAHHQLDLALDPFPHGGGVTSLESLMMGVPVVTLLWPTMAGRVTASIMTALGLPDWIAKTREQYIELAIQKARDLQSLAALRKQLRSIFTSSVMGDQVAYTRAVEQEYRNLWIKWCARTSSKSG